MRVWKSAKISRAILTCFACGIPLATTAIAAGVAQTDVVRPTNVQTHNPQKDSTRPQGTEKPVEAAPKRPAKPVPPPVVPKSQAPIVHVPSEKFLFPSLRFLAHYDPWKLQVSDVFLLQDNIASLKRKHPDCRRITSESDKQSLTGWVACSDTSHFQAEGQEVIFTYATVNEVLTGVAYTFNSQQRALQFAENVKETLTNKGIPTFHEVHSSESETTDSPMFAISVHPAQTGFLVKIDAHFQDQIPETEQYAKAKLSKIEFGNLTLGVTKRNTLPKIPRSCEELSKNPEGSPLEFYGICFEFPYEAHMQLDFNEATGILETAVLSPIGASTGAIVEDMLAKRFGSPQYCKKLTTDMELVTIKSERHRGILRLRRINGRPGMVYAGTCESPIIYAHDMRYIFHNRILNKDDIMSAYERRKRFVDDTEEHLQAFGERMDKVRGFFD